MRALGFNDFWEYYFSAEKFRKQKKEEEKKAKELAIVEAHRQGKSLRQIGEEMGIHYSSVKRILDNAIKNEKYPF